MDYHSWSVRWTEEHLAKPCEADERERCRAGTPTSTSWRSQRLEANRTPNRQQRKVLTGVGSCAWSFHFLLDRHLPLAVKEFVRHLLTSSKALSFSSNSFFKSSTEWQRERERERERNSLQKWTTMTVIIIKWDHGLPHPLKEPVTRPRELVPVPISKLTHLFGHCFWRIIQKPLPAQCTGLVVPSREEHWFQLLTYIAIRQLASPNETAI